MMDANNKRLNRMKRIEAIARWVSLMGIAGLIAQITQTAWAEDAPIINPYAPSDDMGTAEDPQFEGDVQGDGASFFPEDGNQGINPSANASPSQNAGGRAAKAGATGGKRPGRVSIGGAPPSGVTQHSQVQALTVDANTGEGCKDIVTDFNFPDAEIMDIAKALGKLVGKNFILDNKDVKGKISIISNSPITCGDAWKAFLTALDMNNFALIPSGKYIRIARTRDARDKQLKTYTGNYTPDTDALITRLFPLKYLSAEEVSRNFRSFMPTNSRIIPYEQTNTLIITDTGSNITKLQKLLEILDVEGYDAGIEVIAVKYASATELSKLIDTLIPGTGGGAGPGGAPRFGGSGGRFSARRTKEGGIINTIIGDERTNTLIVHANSKGADQVRELVNRLDQKLPASNGGGKVHVIYLQFADSEQLANTLNTISQAGAGGARPAAPGGGTGVNPIQANLFEGSIKVSPDKSTNSLVVTATPADFTTVQRVVNKLDIPRDQVFAEVVIMELQQGKGFDFSANFINPRSGIGLLPKAADITNFATAPFTQSGAILNFAAGGETTLKINDKDVKVRNINALIKAITTDSNATILATPQILSLDNTEATFETTEKIPVANSTVSNGVVSKSIGKEDISLSIKIKPQINKLSNFVKLDIDAKLSDINVRTLPKNVEDDAFATVVRNAKTSVVVADNDTVVLGGLTRDNQQETSSKIPVLGDIPLLGWLFRSKKTESSKSNLLIFITPKIIRQYESVRAILDKKLEERDQFVEANAGGKDPQPGFTQKLKNSLPDLKKLFEEKPKTSFALDNDDEVKAPTPPTIPESVVAPAPSVTPPPSVTQP